MSDADDPAKLKSRNDVRARNILDFTLESPSLNKLLNKLFNDLCSLLRRSFLLFFSAYGWCHHAFGHQFRILSLLILVLELIVDGALIPNRNNSAQNMAHLRFVDVAAMEKRLAAISDSTKICFRCFQTSFLRLGFTLTAADLAYYFLASNISLSSISNDSIFFESKFELVQYFVYLILCFLLLVHRTCIAMVNVLLVQRLHTNWVTVMQHLGFYIVSA